MKKMKLLPLAICLASAPVFALEQGEYRLNYFGSVGITHLGGEDQGRSYGVSGKPPIPGAATSCPSSVPSSPMA